MSILTNAGLRDVESGQDPTPDIQSNFEMLVLPTNGTWRIKKTTSGIFLQFYNADTVKFHTFFPSGAEGQVHTNWGPGET